MPPGVVPSPPHRGLPQMELGLTNSCRSVPATGVSHIPDQPRLVDFHAKIRDGYDGQENCAAFSEQTLLH